MFIPQPKCNVRNNPEMNATEKKAHELWFTHPKSIEQWNEFKVCQNALIDFWHQAGITRKETN